MDEEVDILCRGLGLPDLYTSTSTSIRIELHLENSWSGAGFSLLYLKKGILFTLKILIQKSFEVSHNMLISCTDVIFFHPQINLT